MMVVTVSAWERELQPRPIKHDSRTPVRPCYSLLILRKHCRLPSKSREPLAVVISQHRELLEEADITMKTP